MKLICILLTFFALSAQASESSFWMFTSESDELFTGTDEQELKKIEGLIPKACSKDSGYKSECRCIRVCRSFVHRDGVRIQNPATATTSSNSIPAEPLPLKRLLPELAKHERLTASSPVRR